MRVDLPSGGWATLRDIDQQPINNRERQRLSRAAGNEADALGSAWTIGNHLVALLVTEWSLDLPLPDPSLPDPLDGSLGDMLPGDYDALFTVVYRWVPVIFPDFNVNPAPSSPTVPSSASNGSSLEGIPATMSSHPTSGPGSS